jgi:predicted metalloenzyme YecM
MEREVRRCFKKGLLRSFHGWSQDKEIEMEELREWIFEKEDARDFYHHLCKFTFTTYEINEIIFVLRDEPMPTTVHNMINQYGSIVSKKMIQEMILFVDDNI